MKKIFFPLLTIIIAATACTTTPYSGSCKLTTQVDSVSYCLGYFEAKGFKEMMTRMPFDTLDIKLLAASFAKSKLTDRYLEQRNKQFDEIDEEAFCYGFAHMLLKGECYFDDTYADVIVRRKFDQVRARETARRDSIGAQNALNGKKFIQDYLAKYPDADTLPGGKGVVYRPIVKGKGAKPTLTDKVKCHYTGRLINDSIFDSSNHGDSIPQPTTFKVQGVIKGWQDALQQMPVGSKWEVVVPGERAYGKRGQGDKIGPNETLVFEIELVEVEKASNKAKNKNKK